MLDENLPTFYLRPNNQQKHLWTIYLCQYGDDPEPAYTLRYPDPASPSSKNRYAVALCDPFVPDVIYGEILIIPEWTQPSLSAEAIRLNGGVTPPPEPILPSQFIVHLYNPDQQVTIRYKHKTWNTPATWEFEMPQHTFRQPSASTLDRTQTDPALADTTPKLRFSWRKDSKLSKDLTCLLSGKTSTLSEGKTKSKEPDITLSIFKALRELTLYEPNLYRVEMEDFKGLEIVLLLGAVTIRDVYFTPMKDAFRIVREEVGRKPVAGPTGSTVNVSAGTTVQNGTSLQNQKPTPVASNTKTNGKQPAPSRPAETQVARPSPTPAPAPTQQQKKKQELSRKEEDKRTKKKLEEEEKARRKRQAEIDKETRRLQKIYGREEQQVRASSVNLARPPAQSPRPQPPPRQQQPHPPPRPNPRYYYHQQAPSMLHLMPGPVATPRPHAPGSAPPPRPHSTAHFLQPPRPQGQGQGQGQLQPKKSSFFGFRRSSDDSKLHKKRSSMF
ncbi:hypothetical protein CNMCM8980_006558 [Aspergillus fumigatiaffinis]|jgi:hypothetical protein|uniref:Uncharacterized protein n=1 Tax=Aspergillus fumigatiaffinis TaxID=340414 RepID=A0A8H4GQN5_9EURO|nr:hypothetical protein CNMCM5878_005049 [Aspergillus fumigatiaffinis]KAF4217345.1 hypothetical protein CNMCM6457_004477 [Aspergillus fumigatiaffinis]KAF4226315.1 hypothetical protein CNMCM6805_004734 [Aspergillus fumigatiaffinis]KAF4247933.1 hypothetical protein CNMCM8980_006558 [Aspergillus fumigatiaffinis]